MHPEEIIVARVAPPCPLKVGPEDGHILNCLAWLNNKVEDYLSVREDFRSRCTMSEAREGPET